MGRAIVRHPKIFLFDEPLSNLDAKLRTQMRAEIKRLHKRLKVTSIYVTHDQIEAMTLADRIVVMNDGRIEQIGTPMELFNNPVNTFVAGFIGSPPMNQLNAIVNDVDGRLVAKVGNSLITLPKIKALANSSNREVIVGIRPEHVLLQASATSSPIAIELELVETLGSEALLHTQIAKTPFVVKAETRFGDVSHLDKVTTLHIEPDLIKVFDADTGMALATAIQD